METTDIISESIKLLEIKKLGLSEAFQNLQFHCHQVHDLISFIQKSFQDRLKSIQSHQPQYESKPNPNPEKKPIKSDPVTIRPELKSFCENKNGKGLVHYIISLPKDHAAIREELAVAFRGAVAVNPVALVLDAMQDFYSKKGKRTDNNSYLSSIRRICIVLLEILAAVKPEIGAEAKARARQLAVNWKGKISGPALNKLESLGFLQLLITFDLVSEFDLNEITDHFAHVATSGKAVRICAELGLIHKGTDVVQKLVSGGKEILAIRMIIELRVADKYPPVPILKEYVKESVKLAEKIRKDGNNSIQSIIQAATKEANTLRNVIKVVQEFNLESEYSMEPLAKRIEQLMNEKVKVKVKGKGRQRTRTKKHSGSKQPGMTPELSQTDSGSSSSESEPYGSEGSTQSGAPYVRLTPSVAPYWGSILGAAPYTGSTHSGDPYTGSTHSGDPNLELRRNGAPYTGSTLSGTPPYVELRHSDDAHYVGPIPSGAPYLGSTQTGAHYVGPIPSGAPYSGSTQSGAPYAKSSHSGAPYAESTHGGAPYVGSSPSGAPYAESKHSGAPCVGSTPSGVAYAGSTLSGVSSTGSASTSSPYGGSLSGLYGLPGVPPGFPRNLNPASSRLYPSETNLPTGCYDRPTARSGYGLPPAYDPSYESQ